MKNLPLLIPLLLVVGLFVLSQRTRRKAAAQQLEQQRSLGPGAQVMTTSGLYATVVAVLGEDKLALEVSPGVQVTWARAAVRPVPPQPADGAETLEPEATAQDRSPGGSGA